MSLSLRPNHATVKAYYETLHQFGQLHIDHEMAVRSAFQDLLTTCGRRTEPKLTLIPEYRIKRGRGSSVILDGALVDLYKLPHGYWEAKDEKDDLAKEVERKLDKGYPSDNTIFQAPERAILYQGGTRIFDENITRPEALVDVVNQFFEYKAPNIQEWLKAVDEFSDRVPELSQQVESLIKEERRKNPSFRNVFDDFYALCRQAINPNLSEDAVERMLVQHLLTERIFRKIFSNSDFSHRNVVAIEIEKVIAELTKRSLNRDEFLKRLEPFYHAIERNAENATDYTAKQDFLNTVYMRFFQGYSPKEADTHGIVYTPQPIVNFMVRSVEEILQKEFGRSLSDKGVHILDPFVGTGNFITRVMQEIKTTDLPYKFENELHCNEVMLLPYYIASMNIEHAYYERVGEYRAFPGICLVDTFDMAAHRMFTEQNAERIEQQLKSPIFVVIGNPPYNAWQVNENDNNKNRKYEDLDARVSETYSKASLATNKSALSDPYVKSIRWASDRIKEEGAIAFVTNSGFLEALAADGMRKHLSRDFDRIYVLDLGGNVRKNPKLSGTTHNVFGIQVGVSINLFVRKAGPSEARRCQIRYAAADEYWTRTKKYLWLEGLDSASNVKWSTVATDDGSSWIGIAESDDFETLLPLYADNERETTFSLISNGVQTNRDAWVYSFSENALSENVNRLVEVYNQQVREWNLQERDPAELDAFLETDDTAIKWSSRLKERLLAGRTVQFVHANVRRGLYRPFCREYMYFDDTLIHRPGQFPHILPIEDNEKENIVIWLKVGSDWPFFALCSNAMCDQLPQGGSQCFPCYTYAEGGTHRRENITDWALERFRSHYADPSITKWDIFHYVYAILHHPEYRQRYAANLRRELPRIPFVSACHPEAAESPAKQATPNEGPVQLAGSTSAADESIGPSTRKKRGPQDDNAKSSASPASPVSSVLKDFEVFKQFVKAGQRLAEIHVHYEQQPEYPLKKIEKKGEQLDYQVEKMKLNKAKTQLIYNKFLTLDGIPPETYEYHLGNRSALEWIIDQYQVSTDKRSGITNDPNREDDPTYILRLIGQVITVSLETVKIVRTLPPLGIAE